MESEIGSVESPSEMHIEISRTESQGISIQNIEKIKDCIVYDCIGQPVKICDLCQNKTTILIFVRHFLCYTCEEYVEDLARVSPKSLEDAGVQVVVIGCAPWRFIKKFKEKVNFPHQMYCDEQRKIHEILKLNRERDIGNPKDSKHVKSGYFAGLLKTTWRAWESMEWQGDAFQMGGAMVIDPNGRVLFSHKDERATDHCSINTLLSQVGMEPISFPNDPQVEVI